MSTQRLSRRKFIQLSALGGGALALAACGADGTESVASPAEPAGGGSAAGVPSTQQEASVLAGDVLDYALTSDEWPGAFGFVTFRLHEALFDGQPVHFIRTDSSDQSYAREEGLLFVPLLGAALGQGVTSAIYQFDDGRTPVVSHTPADENFSSLFQLHRVSLGDGSRTLDSVAAIEQAVADGAATVEARPICVNYPVVRWPGGEMSVDSKKEVYLGEGQLIRSPDLDNMTVTFKLHGCFPGTRYIVTDTSAAPMAPMMAVSASPPTQKLVALDATDQIWVFGNGITGPGVMGFQPGVFDNQAGQPAWSPFWDHFTILWKDESQARILRSGDEIRAAISGGEIEVFNGTPDSHPTGFVVNCPVPVIAPVTFEA